MPESAVFDFDFYTDPAYLADPHGRLLELLKEAPPVIWTPHQGGHWVLLSYEANLKAARDWETFSSQIIQKAQFEAMEAAQAPGSPHIPRAVPINLDPPDHTRYRLPLNGAFSPKTILALHNSIRALAGELIDNMKSSGRCEFINAVAEQLPVQVFLKLMGLPLERLPEYRELVRGHLASLQDIGQAARELQRMTAVMRDRFIERRDDPKNDLISMLWSLNIDGRPLTMEDMENYGVLLFIAGLDTVTNSMGFGVRHLAKEPALQEELRRNPALIPEAVEEFLRCYSIVQPFRRLTRDIEFEGLPMKENERALLCLPAADLDARTFPNPERVDLRRENKTHIIFNAGPHRCVGSHLARIELQTLYEELLSRLPPFRLDPEHQPSFHGGHVIGVNALHLVWDA